MGKFMKLLYSIMLIVLALLGAVFIAFGIGDNDSLNNLLTYLEDPIYRNVVLGLGVLLITFSIILLVVIIKHRNRGFEVLIEDEKGSVLITRRSLESTMENSIKRFVNCESIKNKAEIFDNDKIKAKAIVDYYTDESAESLGQRIRNEIVNSLEKLTNISDITLDLRLDKKEKQTEKREYGRY